MKGGNPFPTFTKNSQAESQLSAARRLRRARDLRFPREALGRVVAGAHNLTLAAHAWPFAPATTRPGLCAVRDSNLRPPACKAGALPLS